jgi:hypothetical protein
MSEPRLPDLARSFEQHLRAENKSDRTVVLGVELIAGEIPDTRFRVRRRGRDEDPIDLAAPLAYSVEVLAAGLAAGARKATAEPATGHRPPQSGCRQRRRRSTGRWWGEGMHDPPGAAHHHENQAACLRCWTSGRCDGRAPRYRSWSRGRVPLGALLSELLAAESH